MVGMRLKAIGVVALVITIAFSRLLSPSSVRPSAQASGRITGSVLRAGSNEAVPAAIVLISNRDGRIQRTTRTNVQGTFAFSGLPPGFYSVQACSNQFGPSTVASIELKAGLDATLDLPISSDVPRTAEASCNMDSVADSAIPRGPHEYTGKLMSFDVKGDVRDFLRSVALISGVELDADASVNRTVVVHLKDIPWDLALDAVVRTAGLGSDLDGKVLRIAPANPALGQDRVLMGTVTVVGTIAEINFQNPRTQLQVNAPNADGQMKIWPVEWESAEYLKDIGIRPNTLRSGDKVIITGNITSRKTISLISVQRPSDGFSWGYLPPIRWLGSDGVMFVGPAPQ
jgi:hypothetical protein